jgi:hypothetical protein
MFAMSYLAVSAIQAAGIVPITLPPPKDCVERLREAIAVVKGLWSEGQFTFSGMHYTITEMDGWLKPCHHGVTDRVAKATTHESLIDDEADSAAASTAIHDVGASSPHLPITRLALIGEARHTRLLGYAAPAVGMSQRRQPAYARTEAVKP